MVLVKRTHKPVPASPAQSPEEWKGSLCLRRGSAPCQDTSSLQLLKLCVKSGKQSSTWGVGHLHYLSPEPTAGGCPAATPHRQPRDPCLSVSSITGRLRCNTHFPSCHLQVTRSVSRAPKAESSWPPTPGGGGQDPTSWEALGLRVQCSYPPFSHTPCECWRKGWCLASHVAWGSGV